jgi:hypothetical protein
MIIMIKYSFITVTLLISSLFVKAQAPKNYDLSRAYPASSIVINNSKTFVAIRDVPAGTPITSNQFWNSLESLVPTIIPTGQNELHAPDIKEIDALPIIEDLPEEIEDGKNEELVDPNSQNVPPVEAPNTAPGTPPHPDYMETIAELRRQLSEKDQLLTACEEKISDQSYKMERLAEDNSKLNEEINELNSKVEEMDSQLAEVKKDNTSLQSQAENLQAENQNIRYELTTANNNLQEAIRVAETPFINGWVYDPVQGWMFTDAEHYPLVYTHNDQSWNFYELGSSEPRYFFSFATQKWESWDQ